MKKISYYHDTCKVNLYKINSYGEQELADSATVPCLFNWTVGQSHSNWVDYENADATAYLDIDDPWIQANKYRLEGAYLIFDRHEDTIWYKITRVTLGITLLTDNEENNCFVILSKVHPLE